MACPKYTNKIRGCIVQIAVLPPDTSGYCTTNKFARCPFYRMIENKGPLCEYVKDCKLFQFFQARNFNQLLDLTEEFCFTDNHGKCKRYILRSSGAKVPSHMLPDGTLYNKAGWLQNGNHGNSKNCRPNGNSKNNAK